MAADVEGDVRVENLMGAAIDGDQRDGDRIGVKGPVRKGDDLVLIPPRSVKTEALRPADGEGEWKRRRGRLPGTEG